MPSVSDKQRRTMAAAAHDSAFAKKVGIPHAVAVDFHRADQARAKSKRTTPSTEMFGHYY